MRGAILEGRKADPVSQKECDVVVPRSRIAEYVKAAKRIALSKGIRVEPCGHCGDGNIHTEMLRDQGMSDEKWKSATHACLKELYALSKELGDQLSGEHGIGNGRLEFLEEFVGPRMIRLYKTIKLAFGIAQFGLMTVVSKGYAYLGYAAFITLFVPFVIHVIVTRGKEI